jgi:hypothetical protein
MHISIWNNEGAGFLSVSKNETDFLQNFVWAVLKLKIRLNTHDQFVSLLCSIMLKQNSKIFGSHFTVVLMIIDKLIGNV